MTTSTINQLIDLFARAFRELGVDVAMEEVERTAAMIHHSMDHGRRRYHRSVHVFELCRGTSAHQTLAALFHDVIYCQLDDGLPLKAAPLLEKDFRLSADPWSTVVPHSEEPRLEICRILFGFEAGQTVTLSEGLNEYLSAVVAMSSLEALLPAEHLVAVTACIEGTVPFRPQSKDSDGPFCNIEKRLPTAASILGTKLTAEAIHSITADAVGLANRDVASFSVADPSHFLAGTWLLIEESNDDLSAVGVYTLRDYRAALVSMDTFLRGLNPAHVFHTYDGQPPTAEFRVLCTEATRNIAFACEYLGVKILTIAILEAIASLTGGDCTVSMLLGDITTSGGMKPERVEDHLPDTVAADSTDPQLLHILEGGRAWESGTDLTTSPVSSFVYKRLGSERFHTLLDQAHLLFDGKLEPKAFLEMLDSQTASSIVRACSKIALSRTERLLALDREMVGADTSAA